VSEYLSVSEAGRRQSVSPSAVTRWILTGAALRDGTRLKLKAIRLPGGFRTTQQWVDEFVEGLTRDRTGVEAPPPGAEMRAAEATARMGARGFVCEPRG
jgi:hypothetical protein